MNNVAAIALCGLVAAIIAYGLYLHLTGDPMDDKDDLNDP